MSKTRCKLTEKEYAEKNNENKKFQCERCKRTSNDKDKLCKPKKV